MHTPDQAKELWCPMGRIGVMPNHGGPSSINDPSVDFRCNCIADKCSMWRWVHATASLPTETQGAGGQMARTYETKTVRTHGYCGLAPLHMQPAS